MRDSQPPPTYGGGLPSKGLTAPHLGKGDLPLEWAADPSSYGERRLPSTLGRTPTPPNFYYYYYYYFLW
jgi:hypothetical protein